MPFSRILSITSSVKWSNYTNSACYFITIVVNEREPLFGYINDDTMHLNDAGRMVVETISHIEKLHPGCTVPHKIVMPNHIHFILQTPWSTALPEIIRQFKSRTTTEYARRVTSDGWPRFDIHLWQRSYYDHIIRNQQEYTHIANYIETNPTRWTNDRFAILFKTPKDTTSTEYTAPSTIP